MISQNLWLRKAQKNTFDPMLKFVNELHRDLELVYVCQICLSWEILCWQHEKIQEMKKYDSQWPRRYNIVAGDFQFFQVLIQRFVEDEPFHQDHNRVQYYVNNRSLIRNLLQVPIIKGIIFFIIIQLFIILLDMSHCSILTCVLLFNALFFYYYIIIKIHSFLKIY